MDTEISFEEALAVLGLDPQGEPSKRQVRRAYLKQLKQHKPEQDPAGFMRLRAAYELARSVVDLRRAALLDGEMALERGEPATTVSGEQGPDARSEIRGEARSASEPGAPSVPDFATRIQALDSATQMSERVRLAQEAWETLPEEVEAFWLWVEELDLQLLVIEEERQEREREPEPAADAAEQSAPFEQASPDPDAPPPDGGRPRRADEVPTDGEVVAAREALRQALVQGHRQGIPGCLQRLVYGYADTLDDALRREAMERAEPDLWSRLAVAAVRRGEPEVAAGLTERVLAHEAEAAEVDSWLLQEAMSVCLGLLRLGRTPRARAIGLRLRRIVSDHRLELQMLQSSGARWSIFEELVFVAPDLDAELLQRLAAMLLASNEHVETRAIRWVEAYLWEDPQRISAAQAVLEERAPSVWAVVDQTMRFVPERGTVPPAPGHAPPAWLVLLVVVVGLALARTAADSLSMCTGDERSPGTLPAPKTVPGWAASRETGPEPHPTSARPGPRPALVAVQKSGLRVHLRQVYRFCVFGRADQADPLCSAVRAAEDALEKQRCPDLRKALGSILEWVRDVGRSGRWPPPQVVKQGEPLFPKSAQALSKILEDVRRAGCGGGSPSPERAHEPKNIRREP